MVISVKNRTNFHPHGIGISAGSQKKTRMMGYRVEKDVWRYFSSLDTIHECDNRQTDGRTLGDSKDRAYA